MGKFLFVSLCLVILAQSAFSIPITSCQIISSPGYYTLSNDLASTTGTCISVESQDVSIDCQGHSITGSNYPGADYGIITNSSNTSINNCSISGFMHAAKFNLAPNGLVDGSDLSSAANYGTGLFIYFSDNVQVKNSLISSSNYAALLSHFFSQHATIENNQINAPSDSAVYLMGGHYSAIRNNEISGKFGINMDNQVYNRFLNITNNSIQSTNTGITLASADYSVVANNTVNSTGGNGSLYLDSTSDCQISGNSFRSYGAPGVKSKAGDNRNDIIYNSIYSSTSAAIELPASSGANKFYFNNVSAPVWVSNANLANHFNTSQGGVAKGNYYDQIWTYDIIDSNSDTWGESGSQYPANSSNLPSRWQGSGADWGPWTNRTSGQPNPFLVTSCGILNSSGANYTLGQNLTANSTCIIIAAPNVTLDCQSHSIRGSNISGSYGVYSNQPNTHVMNCTISNFQYGIFFENTQWGAISGNEVFSNTYHGIELQGATSAYIYNNYAHHNTYDGIQLNLGSNNSAIMFNRGIRNGRQQIYVLSSNGVTTTSNTLSSANPAEAAIRFNNAQNCMSYYNNITGAVWINNNGATNSFDTLVGGYGVGNIYYAANGQPSWQIFNLVDTNGNHYADIGSSVPFSRSTLKNYWQGIGDDAHPYSG